MSRTFLDIFDAVMGIILLVLLGLTFQVLWSWFVSPIFEIAPLAITQAVGIVLTGKLLMQRSVSYSKMREAFETKSSNAPETVYEVFLKFFTTGGYVSWLSDNRSCC